MHSRKQILQKMTQFYEIKIKRNKRAMRLQVDNEFQQVKLKDLYDKNNVEMFATSVRGGKLLQLHKKLENLRQEYQN